MDGIPIFQGYIKPTRGSCIQFILYSLAFCVERRLDDFLLILSLQEYEKQSSRLSQTSKPLFHKRYSCTVIQGISFFSKDSLYDEHPYILENFISICVLMNDRFYVFLFLILETIFKFKREYRINY